MNRQGQHLARGLLAFREIAGTICEIAEAFLHMQRKRVINVAAHAILVQIGLQTISLRSANHELIVNMPRLVGGRHRQPDGNTRQIRPIARRILLPAGSLRVQILQFHPQNRGLQSIESGIEPHPLMKVLPERPMHSKRLQFLRQALIAR